MYSNLKALEREHLDNIFLEIFQKELMIVAAPLGYGKTTAVKSFFSKHGEIKELWVQMGHAEVDEEWVWKKFCEALQEQGTELYRAMTEWGLPRSEQETERFISIIRENTDVPICVIMDDYEDYNLPVINKLIERLVYEEIPNLHLMIISRICPDIPFEEMILKGYCTVVGQKLLALNREESEKVFEINDVILSRDEAEAMYKYTDGWIAAVYLALYDHKKTGRFEHLTNVGRLLKTAIFDKLSAEMQEVCAKMSLFECFTYKEACYVSERKLPFMALLQMKEQFGFLQYDAKTGSYTMHTLLKTVALNELERRNIDKNQLLIRCGECREKEERYTDAIICYKRAGAEDKLLKLLSCEMRELIYEQIPVMIDEIFESIALEVKLQYHVAYISYIKHVILKRNAKAGQKLYAEAAAGYEELYGDKEGYGRLKGELLILEAILAFNDLELINSRMKEAEQLLGGQFSGIFDQTLLTYGAPSMSSLYYRKSGELKKTIEQEKEYASYFMRLIKGVTGDWNNFFDAEYALMTNDIARAAALSKRVIEKAVLIGGVCVIISGYFMQLRCLIHMGKEKEFHLIMEEFENRMSGIIRPSLRIDYELATGYLYARIGRADRVAEWLRKFQPEECGRMVRNVRSSSVVYGVILCGSGKWGLLEAVAEQMLIPYDKTNHTYITIYGYIFKAAALLNLEGEEEGCAYLLKAVELAAPDSLKAPFIETGTEILPLIEILSPKNRFCAELKPAIKGYSKALQSFQIKRTALTPREAELMGYVKAGLRNSDISEKMHIALVTVEKNLTSIYRKLNVSNRAAAIAGMEELNIN